MVDCLPLTWLALPWLDGADGPADTVSRVLQSVFVIMLGSM